MKGVKEEKGKRRKEGREGGKEGRILIGVKEELKRDV